MLDPSITGYGAIGVLVIAVHAWTRRELLRELGMRKKLKEKEFSDVTPDITSNPLAFRIKRLEDRWDERIGQLEDRLGDSEREMELRLERLDREIHALKRKHA